MWCLEIWFLIKYMDNGIKNMKKIPKHRILKKEKK